ncbi:TetR family transcriptional regulator [Streptomyces sp. NPDC005009]
MANLREAQKQMPRRLLLESGLELFKTKGYAATTVDDIATAAAPHA